MTYYSDTIKVVFWLGDGMADASIVCACADVSLDVLEDIEKAFRSAEDGERPEGTPDNAFLCEYVAFYNDDVRDDLGNLEMRGYWEFTPTGRYETGEMLDAAGGAQ
jgi:hypothetical protein